jgi:hypothetical protein
MREDSEAAVGRCGWCCCCLAEAAVVVAVVVYVAAVVLLHFVENISYLLIIGIHY